MAARRKYLKEEEMLKIKLLNTIVTVANKDIKILEWEKKDLLARETVSVSSLVSSRTDLKNYIDSLKKEFKIKGSFGFDPVTGEVISE